MWRASNKRSHRTAGPAGRTHAPGFTLVEILIAIAIFGILAAMSYRALTAVLETRDRVERENKKWRTIAFAMTQMEQDLSAVLNREVRDSTGALRPPLVGNPVPALGDGQLVLTRIGELDIDGAETAPIRVGYVLRNGVLYHMTWPVLDQGVRSDPALTPLLSGVQHMEYAYAGASGQPTPFWPQSGNVGAGAPPAAVAVRITFDSGEQISRMFAIGPAITQ